MQEALNNVAKHSRADRVVLRLHSSGSELQLIIIDNGAGFDLEKIMTREGPARGLGLVSMRERVELSGGEFSISTQTGRGTKIQASWRLNQVND